MARRSKRSQSLLKSKDVEIARERMQHLFGRREAKRMSEGPEADETLVYLQK